MRRIIVGGTGFVGRALVQNWLKDSVAVIVVGRSEEKINRMFGSSVKTALLDEMDTQPSEFFNGVDCIVNLAGANIAQKRWNPERREEIMSSRIKTTEMLADCCLKHKIPLYNASAIGIYGLECVSPADPKQKWDEYSSINTIDPKTFLEQVSILWEKAASSLKDTGIPCVHLRFGLILGEKGGALQKMIFPFRFFLGGPLGLGKQVVSWVSLKDALGAINFLIAHKEIIGPVNIVSPFCVDQMSLAREIGKVLKRPSSFPTPGFVLKCLMGDMAHELLLNGAAVFPKRLTESGFQFQNPHIAEALQEILTPPRQPQT